MIQETEPMLSLEMEEESELLDASSTKPSGFTSVNQSPKQKSRKKSRRRTDTVTIPNEEWEMLKQQKNLTILKLLNDQEEEAESPSSKRNDGKH